MTGGARLAASVLVGALVGIWSAVALLLVGADGATALVFALGAGLLALVGTAVALGL